MTFRGFGIRGLSVCEAVGILSYSGFYGIPSLDLFCQHAEREACSSAFRVIEKDESVPLPQYITVPQ